MGVAAIFAWLYMLWFLLGFRLTGPFVIMLWHMLVSDVIRFFALHGVFMMGFAEAFYVLTGKGGWSEFTAHIQECFVLALNGSDLQANDDAEFPVFVVSLITFYVVVASVILLNLLVAMMVRAHTRSRAQNCGAMGHVYVHGAAGRYHEPCIPGPSTSSSRSVIQP